jgi:hypothetical protein
MTMNWYVAESLMNERSAQFAVADARRWPELDHARRMQSARELRSIPPQPVRRNPRPASDPDLLHRFRNVLHGLVVRHPVAQR